MFGWISPGLVFVDEFKDKLRTVGSRFHTLMIEMGAHHDNFLLGFIMSEHPNRNKAIAGSIPSSRWPIRGFAEPYSLRIFEFPRCWAVENGRILSGSLAIISTDTNIAPRWTQGGCF